MLRSMNSIFKVLFLLFVCARAFAVEDDAKWAGNLEMNGYRLGTYKDFAKDWRLVTVRYRVDSGEFRFVYANPIAWKAMSEGKKSYPDGAVFAKKAYVLSHDSSFPSSLVPEDLTRYQLMVKNAAKHAETDGWGYALFDPTGRTFAGEPNAVSNACHACHQIVKNGDYVFSKELSTEIQFTSVKNGALKKQDGSSALPGFSTVEAKALPAVVRSHLPEGSSKVRSLGGNLKKMLFQGTLDEIRPFLGVEAKRSKLPALLVSEDGTRYSIVYPDKETKGDCKSGATKGAAMVYVTTVPKAIGTMPTRTYAPMLKDAVDVVTQSVCFPAGGE